MTTNQFSIFKPLTACVVFALSLLCCANSFAQLPPSPTLQNPVTELQTIVNQTQQAVQTERDSISNNPDQLNQLVRKNLLPYMAIDRMAATALGPKWSTATPQQKTDFIEQFTYMLTRAYASALLKADQYQVVIYPLRTNSWQTATQMTLPGTVTASGTGESSSVTYYVVRVGNNWKIYDFALEGVSVMQNFQAQLQGFPTMDTVLKRIQQVNAGQG